MKEAFVMNVAERNSAMSHDRLPQTWTPVCTLDDIVPNTGVCALVNGGQVAVFHVADGEGGVYAIDNFDPGSRAAVLSRGLIGSLGERIVVASPIYKHHFDLRTGECLEAPENSVSAYPVRVESGKVWVAA
jgi:nitrite reductase (NADH) small subunit